jgi:5-carboxymethyl-2-hydroxymuconate isomerase
MPQFILEYSENVIEQDHLPALLQKINFYLTDVLPADIHACKSRAIKQTIFCVGEGQPSNAFIHGTLKIMPGRTFEKLTEAGNGIMDILKSHFSESAKQLNLQITLEIDELQKTYFK